ncbi:hypothetical protein VTP01DRAFT_7232 [Rhizomucor pusillus]|uniref:uncharacterized protein n=1 Tax=Rhizomucor pusillus TaxID=4840 RepID=UPI00374347ED
MLDSYFFVGELCLYLSDTLKERDSKLKGQGRLISFRDACNHVGSFNIVAILYWAPSVMNKLTSFNRTFVDALKIDNQSRTKYLPPRNAFLPGCRSDIIQNQTAKFDG